MKRQTEKQVGGDKLQGLVTALGTFISTSYCYNVSTNC
jgi:hypothetical protein